MSPARSVRPYEYRWLPMLIGGLLVSALLIGNIILYVVERQLMQTTGHTLALAAGAVADELDRIVFERQGDVRMAARAFAGRCSDQPYVSAYLAWMRQAYHPLYESLSVVDARGHVMASTTAEWVGKDLSEQPWFALVRDGRGTGVHQWESTELPAQETDAGVSFAAPITDSSGIFCGAFMARMGPTVLGEVVTRERHSSSADMMSLPSLEYQFVTSTGRTFVDSSQQAGATLANLRELAVPSFLRTESEQVGSLEEMHARRQVPVVTGFARTRGFRDSANPEWTVLLRVDRSALLTPIRTRVAFVGVLALIGVVPLTVGLVWTARRLRTVGRAAQSEEARAVAAEDAQHRLATIVESSNDAIISRTLDGIVLSWNKGAERLFGYTDEEVVGKPIASWLPPDRSEEESLIIVRLRQGERIEHFETVRRRKDGRLIDVSLTVSPVVDEQGAIVGVSIIAHDLTEQKRAEENFRRIVEEAPNGMILVDQKGAIALVNAQAEQLFGYSREELFGQSIETLVPARLRGAHPGHRVAFSADPERRAMGAGRDLYGLHKDGREISIEIGLNSFETKDGRMVLSSIVDITERKRAEEEIRRRGQLLEAANKELEAFSYSVSHDLRTPLRSIDGFSQALLEDCAGLLNEQGKDYLSRIRAASQRMGQLIDDLLSLSHATRVKLRREPVDLSALALGSAAEVRKIWPGRQIELVVAPGLRAQGDPRLLRIVFDNLLGNAWKFTSKQERAAIEVGTMSHDGTTAYFVRDNGAGFDMAYAGKLFGAFQRLHAMTEYPGTGIGLATVQRIVARHGGLVWAESQVGQGAIVYFTLGERNAQ